VPSPGNLDLIVQADTLAIDAVLVAIFADLQRRGLTTFRANLGASTLSLNLTSLEIGNIRAVIPSDRFAGTLASFIIKAGAVLTTPGILPPINDTLTIALDDLQVSITVTPGGLPTGISLGFAGFTPTVTGLTALAQQLNGLLNLLGVVIRLVLTPLGMIPIPISQMADIFVKLGILFDAGFPVLAPSNSPAIGPGGVPLGGSAGLVAAADFQNSSAHASNFRAITDLIPPIGGPIIPPNSEMTAAAQINQRLANTAIAIGFAKGYFPQSAAIGGIGFWITSFSVNFAEPVAPSTARIGASFSAQGKLKKNLCGALGSFFGLSRSVKIKVWGDVTADGRITGTDLVFQYDATLTAKVSVPTIYGVVLGIVLGPQIFIFLLLLVQILNIIADSVLPLAFANVQLNGANLTVTLQHLRLGLSLFAITANAQVGGTGVIDLNQVVTLATANFPLNISFPSDGLATQLLAASQGDGDLLIGARITP
jgi:hypothetical protein